MPHPKKADNLYTETLDQELCVYDWQQQQLHALNPTAALVWDQCDGQTSPAAMATRLETELNVSNAEGLVAMSLNRLGQAGLLAEKTPLNRSYSRREMLKMTGISLAMLPVVKSMNLPSPAQAQCSPNCTLTGLVAVDAADCQTQATNLIAPDSIICNINFNNGNCTVDYFAPSGCN